jgi:hypothetical protein
MYSSKTLSGLTEVILMRFEDQAKTVGSDTPLSARKVYPIIYFVQEVDPMLCSRRHQLLD